MKRTSLATILTMISTSALVACSSSDVAGGPATTEDVDAGPPVEQPAPVEADAGRVVKADPPVAPPGCDGTALPKDNACVIDEGLGVFVSKTKGSDASGDGSRAKPYGSLKTAIAAGAQGKRVYACSEEFTESVVLAEGVSMFGGFDCAQNWAFTGTRAKIKGTSLPAVKANALNAPIRLDSFDIEAPAAAEPSRSSIAMVASEVKDLLIANSSITAMNALAGPDGSAPPTVTNDAANIDGKDGGPGQKCALLNGGCFALLRGGGGTNTCSGISGVTAGPGGLGGNGGHYSRKNGVFTLVESPKSGEAASPGTAAGAIVLSLVVATNGAQGPNGTNGSTAQAGTLSLAGWVPGDGKAGTNGSPGQGGGSGAGLNMYKDEATSDGEWYAGGGGGGGAGGCPGVAGGAGKGGGASIGLVSWNSGIRLEASNINAGNGGAGGRGTLGASPLAGGAAGKSAKATATTNGAPGGYGGHAGWSGAGAGGHSIGVAYKGTSPSLGGATPTVGTAGKGRAAESKTELALVKTLPASPDGIAAATWPIP